MVSQTVYAAGIALVVLTLAAAVFGAPREQFHEEPVVVAEEAQPTELHAVRVKPEKKKPEQKKPEQKKPEEEKHQEEKHHDAGHGEEHRAPEEAFSVEPFTGAMWAKY